MELTRVLPTHELLTVQELAEYLAIPPKTLANWRSIKLGPDYVKVGGAVRYRRSDVLRWIDGQVHRVDGGHR
jgi:excisionase family DNA binding protein